MQGRGGPKATGMGKPSASSSFEEGAKSFPAPLRGKAGSIQGAAMGDEQSSQDIDCRFIIRRSSRLRNAGSQHSPAVLVLNAAGIPESAARATRWRSHFRSQASCWKRPCLGCIFCNNPQIVTQSGAHKIG